MLLLARRRAVLEEPAHEAEEGPHLVHLDAGDAERREDVEEGVAEEEPHHPAAERTDEHSHQRSDEDDAAEGDEGTHDDDEPTE